MNQAVAPEEIVVTGSGLVCALGLNKPDTWQEIVRGRCGLRPLTALEQPMPSASGGQVPQRDSSGDETKPREVRLLRLALDEALIESGIAPGRHYPAERCAIVLGTTLGGMRAAGQFLRDGRHAALQQFIASAVVQQVAADLPIAGPAWTTCAACASGLSAVALGMTLLRGGACDLVIAGGYDPISEYVWAGFTSLRLVAPGPPRPFSRDRVGMQLGEGYAILVLERAADAARRGAAAQAVVAGFGETSDAHHLTQPQPDGAGAARAMELALRDADVNARRIDMIAAHATATPNNDAAEFQAFGRVFGERLPEIPVVAFKSHLGHTLGGAGAVELVLSLMSMQHQMVPPTATVKPGEIEFTGLRVATDKALPTRMNHAMNLSLGFGGSNACVVLRHADQRMDRRPVTTTTAPPDVAVTGVGVILPGAIGNNAFVERLRNNSGDVVGGPIDEAQYATMFNARRARRMSEFVKLILAATSQALLDAGVDDVATFAAGCGAVLGSAHGATAYSESYYRQVVVEGLLAANPMLFAEGVPNVGNAQLSLMIQLTGGAQTIVGSRTAGLDALLLGVERVRAGVYDRMIVGAAEEHSQLVQETYEHCVAAPMNREAAGRGAGTMGSGAVTLVLERADAAAARGARVRAILGSSGSCRAATGNVRSLVEGASSLLQRMNTTGWLISSACSATAIDLEDAVFRCVDGPSHAMLSVLRGRAAETFSVNPLAAAAAAMLAGPTALAGATRPQVKSAQAAILCIDPIGFASAIRLHLPDRTENR